MLVRKEVGLSMIGTIVALGVLGDGSSPSPLERIVVLTTNSSFVTSVEVK